MPSSSREEFAGTLDRHVTIEQPTETRNAIGEVLATSWSTFSPWWTRKEFQAGSESEQDGQRYATAVVRWVGRYIAGVTDKMRINDGGTLFDITAVDETMKRQGQMVLQTVQRAAGTT